MQRNTFFLSHLYVERCDSRICIGKNPNAKYYCRQKPHAQHGIAIGLYSCIDSLHEPPHSRQRASASSFGASQHSRHIVTWPQRMASMHASFSPHWRHAPPSAHGHGVYRSPPGFSSFAVSTSFSVSTSFDKLEEGL